MTARKDNPAEETADRPLVISWGMEVGWTQSLEHLTEYLAKA